MDVAAVRLPDPVHTRRVVRDERRLAAAAALGSVVVDPWCDQLTTAVAARLNVPVVLLTVVEPHRQRFIGAFGLSRPRFARRERR